MNNWQEELEKIWDNMIDQQIPDEPKIADFFSDWGYREEDFIERKDDKYT